MAIHLEFDLAATPADVWAIIGDPGRTDWVPGVTGCEYDGEVRRFTMPGAGVLAERILLLDPARRRIEYSVIESAAPLAAHRAAMEVSAHADGARVTWETTVEPAVVEPFIRQNMDAAIAQLRALLAR